MYKKREREREKERERERQTDRQTDRQRETDRDRDRERQRDDDVTYIVLIYSRRRLQNLTKGLFQVYEIFLLHFFTAHRTELFLIIGAD